MSTLVPFAQGIPQLFWLWESNIYIDVLFIDKSAIAEDPVLLPRDSRADVVLVWSMALNVNKIVFVLDLFPTNDPKASLPLMI